MNKEQKVDFLKRLANGKATINELTQIDPFDATIPVLNWDEAAKGIYTNLSGLYFEEHNIKPGTLSLTRAELHTYMKKAGRYRYCMYSSFPYDEGDYKDDENYKSIVFR